MCVCVIFLYLDVEGIKLHLTSFLLSHIDYCLLVLLFMAQQCSCAWTTHKDYRQEREDCGCVQEEVTVLRERQYCHLICVWLPIEMASLITLLVYC